MGHWVRGVEAMVLGFACASMYINMICLSSPFYSK